MDLNSSPPRRRPEGGEDGAATESAVDISRREREERKKRRIGLFSQTSSLISMRPASSSRNPTATKIIIPQGWIDCPGLGQPIGYLIPSKVPLSEFLNEYVPPGKRYSFKQVLRIRRNTRIGLVIDLTNSCRYYSPIDLSKTHNIYKHVQIKCKGHGAAPDNVAVNRFVHEVNEFLRIEKNPKEYILVHCTHGHNRTGFMIVHYLMRSCPAMSVTQALQMFSHSRPPGIYKPDYIDALYTFYHEIKPESVTCPPTPDWKRSSEQLDLNRKAVGDGDGDGGGGGDGDGGGGGDDDDDDDKDKDNAPPGLVQVSEDSMMSNDDVLGDEIHPSQEREYRRFCYKMFMIDIRGREHTVRFPGSHPVSLDRESLQLLRQRYYYATWKADGTRYMMLLTTDGCYLIDRTFRFRRVQMRFPCRQGISEERVHHHHYTLLDGEMVIDYQNNRYRKARRRYLIYDVVAMNGESFVERTFSERWNMVMPEVINPRIDEMRTSHCYRYDLEPFGVSLHFLSPFWYKMLKVIILSLPHESDGLIFQGYDDPYVRQTHAGLLKWKYPEMNSVDFLFEENNKGQGMLFLNENGNKKLMEGYSVKFGNCSSSYSGKIVECSWDNKAKFWVFKRIRFDKSTPNDINTARKVIKSIEDNITEQVLLKELGEIVLLPMYHDRIKIDPRAALR
ncbi:unnamed protein product [Cochlearia groenlandica]